MSATDALLFIDANKYLDLYRTDKGRKLLAPLSEQAPYIFITQQVVDEVHRNRLGVAADFLRKKGQGMKLYSINVPDHFSGTENGRNDEILSQMRGISRSVSSVNAEIDAHTNEIMTQVAESKDEVSKALTSIFSKAVRATPDEMKRARERKEVGNPPGKRNDPLGDEISWEQILSHFEGKKRLWIISRDGDYGTAFGRELFLNGFLRSEIDQISNAPNVYIFQDLVEGLTHFVETTEVEAKVKLTPDEHVEIGTEEKSLPPIGASRYASPSSQSFESVAEISQVLAALQSSDEIRRALAALQPSEEIRRTVAVLQPSDEIRRALAALQPSEEIRRTVAALQPSEEIRRTVAALQPSEEIRRTLAALQPSVKKKPGGEGE